MGVLFARFLTGRERFLHAEKDSYRPRKITYKPRKISYKARKISYKQRKISYKQRKISYELTYDIKNCVKGYYTKSYKILVSQDSYISRMYYFRFFLESHVLPRAKRADKISCNILVIFITLKHQDMCLKNCVKGYYTSIEIFFLR